jgi:hypothetical protein
MAQPRTLTDNPSVTATSSFYLLNYDRCPVDKPLARYIATNPLGCLQEPGTVRAALKLQGIKQ